MHQQQQAGPSPQQQQAVPWQGPYHLPWPQHPWPQAAIPGVAKEVSDPPAWPGWSNYRLWRKAVVRWDAATDIPVNKRAYRLLNKFEYSMQLHFDHLDESLLSSKDYLDSMLSVLDILSGERSEDQMRRALTGALMHWKRDKQETLTQYVARREQQCLEAQKHGVQLPPLAKGFLLLEGAGLSLQSQANLRTLCGGQLQEAEVMRALRTLDISSAERDQRTFMAEETELDGEESLTSSAAAELLTELEALDLDEAEATEAFAVLEKQQKKSWSANKFFKQALRKDRSGGLAARAAAGSAPASPAVLGGSPSGPPRRKRLSIAELKLVSKCANCGKKGHWHAECKEPKRPKPPQQQPQQQQQQQTHWTEASDGASNTAPTYFAYQGQYSSEFSWAELQTGAFFASFPGEAMVDCGAGQDLIGLRALREHTEVLKSLGLQPVRLNKPPKVAAGIGGRARGLYVVLMPILFTSDAPPGFLEVTVLKEDVPFLLSAGFLTFLQARIDMTKSELHLDRLHCAVPMRRSAGGHCLVDVTKSPANFPLLIPDELAMTLEISPDALMCAKKSKSEITKDAPESSSIPRLFRKVVRIVRNGIMRKRHGQVPTAI
eukprot:2476123-Amphidinium_carterae.1